MSENVFILCQHCLPCKYLNKIFYVKKQSLVGMGLIDVYNIDRSMFQRLLKHELLLLCLSIERNIFKYVFLKPWLPMDILSRT